MQYSADVDSAKEPRLQLEGQNLSYNDNFTPKWKSQVDGQAKKIKNLNFSRHSVGLCEDCRYQESGLEWAWRTTSDLAGRGAPEYRTLGPPPASLILVFHRWRNTFNMARTNASSQGRGRGQGVLKVSWTPLPQHHCSGWSKPSAHHPSPTSQLKLLPAF